MTQGTDLQCVKRSSQETICINKGECTAMKDALETAIEGRRFLLDRDAHEVAMIAGDAIEQNLDHVSLGKLRRFGESQGPPLVVVKGLPEPTYIPPTPYRGYGDDSKVLFGDARLLGLYRIMGIVPVAYEYENHGHLFRNVVPNPDAKGVQSSHGFDAELGWHTDNPCGPFESEQLTANSDRSPIPHFLGFVCLRNRDRQAEPVPTEVLAFEPVLSGLNEQVLAVLCENEFQVNPPSSNRCSPLVGMPLVAMHHGTYQVRFNASPSQVLGLTARAKWAIDQLKVAMSEAELEVTKVDLQPGTVLVFDNYRVAHRRRSFDPGNDWEEARWLRRCFACKSLLSGRFVDRLHWPNLLK